MPPVPGGRKAHRPCPLHDAAAGAETGIWEGKASDSLGPSGPQKGENLSMSVVVVK